MLMHFLRQLENQRLYTTLKFAELSCKQTRHGVVTGIL
jgi:hypothetical protein